MPYGLAAIRADSRIGAAEIPQPPFQKPGPVSQFFSRPRGGGEVVGKAGLSTLDAGSSTARQLAAAMRTVLDAFDRIDLDDEGQALAEELLQRARAVGHPLGAPSQHKDLIIASLAIRHRAPLISRNYRDFIKHRRVGPSHVGTDPPRVRFEPDA